MEKENEFLYYSFEFYEDESSFIVFDHIEIKHKEDEYFSQILQVRNKSRNSNIILDEPPKYRVSLDEIPDARETSVPVVHCKFYLKLAIS